MAVVDSRSGGIGAPSAPAPAVRSIGRYQIVGELATGGMAEILLGRLVGPSGFERAVVIKRILPHLAKQPAFVDMFLDEARIVAGLKHPNVVHVHELGQDGDELFLVMEYLEGESVAGLTRRLRACGERLELGLALHAVAEVCAGLHTAHELADHDGVALNLVHRDVSPSNVLITYDGAVKLLDFGIAQADDRRAQTQAGQIKGKLQYMSPEQCLRYTLDRRSDVFALGILLYELCTMRRLFERKNDLDVLRAICEEPVPAPSSIAPDVPAAVDAICLRALSRKRDARYPTAAEMRRELLATARTLDTDAVPEEALARLMQRVFTDRIEDKRDMLRRFRAGSTPTHVPPAEVDEHVVVPSIVAEEAPDVDQSVTGETVPRTAAPRPGRALAYGVLIAGAVVAVTLASRWAAERSSAATEDARPAPQPATSTATPIVAGAEATAPLPVSPAASVIVRVEATPAADVRVGDEPRGRTPLTVLLARGEAPIEIALERHGYLRWERSIVPSVDQQLVVTLVPRPRPAAPPARSSKPPPPQIPLFR